MSVTYVSTELRQLSRERARFRCEFCLIPERKNAAIAHQIDHVIAEKHGGLTQFDNLALACPTCNRRKGSDLASIDPDSGEITPLFNPRIQKWEEHFAIQADFLLASLNPEGRTTVTFLQINHVRRLIERMALFRPRLS